jgi:transcriptional regulator with XRE-family HTH domain
LGVTQPAVSQWETGTTIPTLSRLRKIAAAYEADIGPLTSAWLRVQGKRPVRGQCEVT